MKPTVYFAKTVFLPSGWAQDVAINVDVDGWITQVQSNQQAAESAILLDGIILPGMANLHSHAFQRGMAGLAERATTEKESFWTWRETMYQFLEKLEPEDQQAIAAQLYVEMLKAGFTSVAEFHYVHHQVDGTPYADRALTSNHIIAAAQETGIAITHLPVLYAGSGFGGLKPTAGQKRFINNEMQIMEIISALVSRYQNNSQVTIGLAHHSLRAVPPEMLREATFAMQKANPLAPIHIHIAEQMKEVNDCLAWSGKRPVEWLMENMDIDKRWCLVHATHLSESETRGLARSEAVAGLCPTTEANLGDGLFNLPHFLEAGGRIGIGSDSHISVSMIEELRMLEYGQRLFHQARNIAKMPKLASVGASLYRAALAGGAQALGRDTSSIEVGKRADFIVLDAQSPNLLYKEKDFIFDSLIFAGNINPIKHVIAGGKHVVRDYHHVLEDKVFAAYRMTLGKFLG